MATEMAGTLFHMGRLLLRMVTATAETSSPTDRLRPRTVTATAETFGWSSSFLKAKGQSRVLSIQGEVIWP